MLGYRTTEIDSGSVDLAERRALPGGDCRVGGGGRREADGGDHAGGNDPEKRPRQTAKRWVHLRSLGRAGLQRGCFDRLPTVCEKVSAGAGQM